MNSIDKQTCGLVLKTLSTISCGLFSGGALYITCVEGPARMTHDASSAITMWRPSFTRAKRMLSKMAVVSAFSAFGAYACMKEEKHSTDWLIVGSAMLSIPPFTLIFISPLNSQLIETEKCISVKGDSWIIENLKHWDKVHSVRTLISLGAFSFVVYSILR